jgi:hypothetical protein
MLARRTLKYLGRIFFWLVLPFFLVEILMTLFDPYLFKGFRQYDPDLGFRVRSYYDFDGSLTNQFGFNDQDYPFQKSPGAFRIMVVGDSFNWMGGRDGNYVGLLRKQLKDHYGYDKVDVINVGYPGTHTGEQLAMLKKFALQYNPDLVVLGFFAGNDFLDADPYRKTIVVDNTFVNIDRRHEHRFLGYPIILQSRVLLLIEQTYLIHRQMKRAKTEADAAAVARGAPVPNGTFSEEAFMNVEMSRLQFGLTRPAEAFQPNIDYIFQSISEMDSLLKSRGIKFMVAIYPDEFQVNPKLLDSVFDRYRLNKGDYDPFRAQLLLKPFLESQEIPCLDFLDQFRAEGQKEDLYLLRNTHWNKAGNQLAADILFKDLAVRVDSLRAAR